MLNHCGSYDWCATKSIQFWEKVMTSYTISSTMHRTMVVKQQAVCHCRGNASLDISAATFLIAYSYSDMFTGAAGSHLILLCQQGGKFDSLLFCTQSHKDGSVLTRLYPNHSVYLPDWSGSVWDSEEMETLEAWEGHRGGVPSHLQPVPSDEEWQHHGPSFQPLAAAWYHYLPARQSRRKADVGVQQPEWYGHWIAVHLHTTR